MKELSHASQIEEEGGKFEDEDIILDRTVRITEDSPSTDIRDSRVFYFDTPAFYVEEGGENNLSMSDSYVVCVPELLNG